MLLCPESSSEKIKFSGGGPEVDSYSTGMWGTISDSHPSRISWGGRGYNCDKTRVVAIQTALRRAAAWIQWGPWGRNWKKKYSESLLGEQKIAGRNRVKWIGDRRVKKTWDTKFRDWCWLGRKNECLTRFEKALAPTQKSYEDETWQAVVQATGKKKNESCINFPRLCDRGDGVLLFLHTNRRKWRTVNLWFNA